MKKKAEKKTAKPKKSKKPRKRRGAAVIIDSITDKVAALTILAARAGIEEGEMAPEEFLAFVTLLISQATDIEARELLADTTLVILDQPGYEDLKRDMLEGLEKVHAFERAKGEA